MAYDEDKATLLRERDLLLWLHAEAVWKLQRFDDPMAAIVDYGVNRIDEMLATVGLSDVSDAGSAVERVTETLKMAAEWRSSRQAWAEEATRLDTLTNPPLATEDEVGDIVYEFGNLNTTLTESVTEKLFEFFDIRPKPLRRQGEQLTKRVCACPPEAAVFPGKWTPPQCAVHPAPSQTVDIPSSMAAGDALVVLADEPVVSSSVLPDGEAQ